MTTSLQYTGNTSTLRVLIFLSCAIVVIVMIAIGQDLLESIRRGYAFYFSESLLFKTVWFVFIPILVILHQRLHHRNPGNTYAIVTLIIVPIAIHLMLTVLVAFTLSLLFYGGRYDLYKFFFYTLANDFYKLIIVYTPFVLAYNLLGYNTTSKAETKSGGGLKAIVINNGRDHIVINTEHIVQITASTPYVYIHTENKKFLHSQTLKSMCTQLDPALFIRVHKSAIVNLSKIKTFQSRLNGDYDLLLTNGGSVRLSRTYATAFKKHFHTRTQDTA